MTPVVQLRLAGVTCFNQTSLIRRGVFLQKTPTLDININGSTINNKSVEMGRGLWLRKEKNTVVITNPAHDFRCIPREVT
jgi:hypothetical protein